MSTEIRAESGTVIIGANKFGGTHVALRSVGFDALLGEYSVPTDRLLSAVETECGVRMVPADAIVIRRDDLLDVLDLGQGIVKLNHDGRNVHTVDAEHDAVYHRMEAIRHLTIAEWADAHPPVDEAQIETLSGAIAQAAFEDGAGGKGSYPTRLARRLVARGVRVPVTP